MVNHIFSKSGKISIASLLLMCSFFASHVGANETKVKELGCASPGVNGLHQIEVIAEAIQKDKRTFKFRVSWDETFRGYAVTGTFLYDRRRRILKYYEIIGGYDDKWKTDSRVNYLFTRVTDKVLLRISALRDAKATEGLPQMEPNSLLKLLPRFGCGKKKLRNSMELQSEHQGSASGNLQLGSFLSPKDFTLGFV